MVNPNLDPTSPLRTGIGRDAQPGTLSLLFFGTDRTKPRGPVTRYDVDRFLDTVVVPRFPDGFTVMHDAAGVWQGGSESAWILAVVTPDGEHDSASVRLEEIRHAYRRQHAQSSVLRVDTACRLSFDPHEIGTGH